MLGRRIGSETGPDLMTSHSGDIDDMPGFLLLHIRQCLGNAVQRPFAVHVDHPVPFVNLEAFKWACGISPALLIIASIRPYACTAPSTIF
jgi:hypothetical protein